MLRSVLAACLIATALPFGAAAQTLTLAPVSVTEWKAVYGRIEARDRLPARARLGGTLVTLSVNEGDLVTAGQVLAEVVDEKIGFQMSALTAQLDALKAQFANAQTELARGEDLLARGVTTVQRLDALRTQVDVLAGQISAQEAQQRVLQQQADEGRVLAPTAGRVLDVPVAAGAVIMPGEPVAMIGGGGTFLRLAVPERHAMALQTGDVIGIETAQGQGEGRLARIYPQIENGRVVADVEVENLSDAFVDARVLVRLPVAERLALLVPQSALAGHSGLDFVQVMAGDTPVSRAIVVGQTHQVDGVAMVEVLSGLVAGDVVVTANE
jgi:RND family efflux transporter MFP subunit